jgi:tellurite resistance-related uncharacterized protein
VPHPTQLPPGLQLVRTTDEFTHTRMPDGLRRAHRIAAGVWGVLRVRAGSVEFAFEDDDPYTTSVEAGATWVIPPQVPHSVSPSSDARFVVEFWK